MLLSRVALLIMALGCVACCAEVNSTKPTPIVNEDIDEGAEQPFDNNRYAGRWELISIDGKPVPDGYGYFVILGMTLGGNDGCNQFGGRFDRPGGGPKTRIGCMGNPIISLDFSDLADHFRSGTLDEDKGILSLPKRGQYPAYVFIKRADKQPKQ